MLLSMFMSFLLARRFHGKTYVLLVTVGLLLISFFSAGLPHESAYEFFGKIESSGIVITDPALLSFPFYAYIHHKFGISYLIETYQLRLLTLRFQELRVSTSDIAGRHFYMTWGDYFLYFAFFSMVNMLGAIIGYRISKATFVENLSRTKTSYGKQSAKEKWATACGWIGFGLILWGILLSWGTYSSRRVFFQTGLTSTSDLYLIAGSISVLIGLLGSLEKASGWPNVFLGGGGLITIIGAGEWISIYYNKPSGYPTIFALSVGPFVTIVGGILAMLAAVLYALHARTQATRQETQPKRSTLSTKAG